MSKQEKMGLYLINTANKYKKIKISLFKNKRGSIFPIRDISNRDFLWNFELDSDINSEYSLFYSQIPTPSAGVSHHFNTLEPIHKYTSFIVERRLCSLFTSVLKRTEGLVFGSMFLCALMYYRLILLPSFSQIIR